MTRRGDAACYAACVRPLGLFVLVLAACLQAGCWSGGPRRPLFGGPATESGAPVLRGAADMHVGMSDLHREHNDLEAATQHLLASEALGELAGLQQNPYRWCAAMARIREAQGDLDGALERPDGDPHRGPHP